MILEQHVELTCPFRLFEVSVLDEWEKIRRSTAKNGVRLRQHPSTHLNDIKMSLTLAKLPLQILWSQGH